MYMWLEEAGLIVGTPEWEKKQIEKMLRPAGTGSGAKKKDLKCSIAQKRSFRNG